MMGLIIIKEYKLSQLTTPPVLSDEAHILIEKINALLCSIQPE